MNAKYNGLQVNPSDTSQLLNVSSEITNNKINIEKLKYPEKFSIPLDTLVSIVSKCQERTFSEEIDYLEELDDDYFEKGLGTSFIKGIPGTFEDLKKREEEYSHNRKAEYKPKSFFELLMGALEDFIMRILLVASLVSIVISVGVADDDHRASAWIEGFAIFMAVLICSSVQAGNDFQKERQFQKLNQVADDRKKVLVFRNGAIQNINQNDIFSGDVIQITEGMEIPADGYLIEASEITCDESAMTGETSPIKKKLLKFCVEERNKIINEGSRNKAHCHDVSTPILLSGTKVLTGDGKFVVLVVGDKSCLGKISSILRTQEAESTPLQQKLEHLARGIGKFGLVSALLILIVLFLRFLIERAADDWSWNNDEHFLQILNFFLLSITVIVVAIPEGLPLSVTISLAYSVKKMLRDKNLVRKLQACETMGGANMICSDKTGTLTQNKMTLTAMWNQNLIEIDPYKENINLSAYVPAISQEIFVFSTLLNSSAILRPEEKGSSTEIAILHFMEHCQYNYEIYRNKFPPELKFPFTSARKRMGFVFYDPNTNRKILLEKGASELVLDSCSKFHAFDGSITNIDNFLRTDMNRVIEEMAGNALRTLVLAYKILTDYDDLETKDDKGVFQIEKSSLTLLCIFGIKDILRQEVPDSVRICRKAGIKVRMVTGDNKLTARAIAKECGIIESGNEFSMVMEGKEFIEIIGGVICENCRLSIDCKCPKDEETSKKEGGKKIRKDTIRNGAEFDRIYPNLDVLARSRPEDKYALVTGLKERQHVVAVTGDGTNDAPALKKADVGFAMGMAGTQVARDAADIILLDDNFSSIVKAVLWGRNIYDSIRKFLQFQLTVNVVAVTVTLIGSAVIKQDVLKPIQMLWINLIMDTFASLALATEEPVPTLLERKPHNRNEYMISKKMTKHIMGQAIYQVSILLVLVFAGEKFLPEYEDALDEEIKKKKYPVSYKYSMNGLEVLHYVRSGRDKLLTDQTISDYEKIFKEIGPSRHFTIIFNTFVWLQLFNFINSRRIRDEKNVFENIAKNPMFLLIVFTIVFLQAILVTHGGIAIFCYKWHNEKQLGGGLDIRQWFICIAFGFGGLAWGYILKLLPEDKCIQAGKKSADPIHDQSKILMLKRSYNERSVNRKFSSMPKQNSSFPKLSKPST